MLIDEIVRAIIQLSIFVTIPLIFWLITAQKSESFFAYVGLNKPKIGHKVKFATGIIVAAGIAISMSLVLDPLLPDDIQFANERFSGQGAKAILPIIIFAFFATGLPEEIVFRGFLGKQLIKKCGFTLGNTIQSIFVWIASRRNYVRDAWFLDSDARNHIYGYTWLGYVLRK